MKKNILIQGMGYVGFANAIACAMVKKNNKYIYNVIGLEKNNINGKKKIRKFNDKIPPIKTLDKSINNNFIKQLKIGNLSCSIDDNVIKNADIILSCIDLNHNNFSKNLSNYLKSIETIFKKIGKRKCDIILQSTLPPGVTEKKVYPLMKKILLKRKISLNKVSLSYSYERVTPGENYLKSIISQDRVYSSINSYSKKRCEIFFKSILNKSSKLYFVKSPTDCEFSKIVENSYRAVNIALTDEWLKFAKYLGVDLLKINNLISYRRTHSNIMKPGIGVGGYCLPKDPYFFKISNKFIFKNKSFKFPLISQAVKINKKMYLNSFNQVLSNLPKKKTILFAGIAYKENVDDIRNSPSLKLAKKLSHTYKVDLYDPLIEKKILNLISIKKINNIRKKYDAVILGVKHQQFLKKNFLESLFKINKKLLIFDFNNIISEKIKNKKKFKKIKIINLT